MARIQTISLSFKEAFIVGGFVALSLSTFALGLRAVRSESELSQVREHNRVLRGRMEKLSTSFAKIRAYTKSAQMLAKPEMTLAAKPLEVVRPTIDELPQVKPDFFEKESGDVERFMASVTLIDNLQKQALILERRLDGLAGILRANKAIVRSIPSMMPAEGFISSDFGVRLNPIQGKRMMHAGIDIAAEFGSSVVAPADGTVTFVGEFEDLGRTIVIDHGNGILTRFGHTEKTFVMKDQKIKRGQKIAAVGNTGHSTGPHLHYEVWLRNNPVDPRDYLFDMSDGPTGVAPQAKSIEARTTEPAPQSPHVKLVSRDG